MSWWNKYSEGQITQAIENALNGGSSASLIHQASVTLDDDAIRGLPTWATRAELVPAPGDGRILAFTSLDLHTVIATAYSNAVVSGRIVFQIFGWGFPITTVAVDPSVLQSTGQWAIRILSLGVSAEVAVPIVSVEDVTDVANKPLALLIDNSGAGDLLDGHFSNNAGGVVEFRVFDVSLNRFLTTAESGWDEETRTFS